MHFWRSEVYKGCLVEMKAWKGLVYLQAPRGNDSLICSVLQLILLLSHLCLHRLQIQAKVVYTALVPAALLVGSVSLPAVIFHLWRPL